MDTVDINAIFNIDGRLAFVLAAGIFADNSIIVYKILELRDIVIGIKRKNFTNSRKIILLARRKCRNLNYQFFVILTYCFC